MHTSGKTCFGEIIMKVTATDSLERSRYTQTKPSLRLKQNSLLLTLFTPTFQISRKRFVCILLITDVRFWLTSILMPGNIPYQVVAFKIIIDEKFTNFPVVQLCKAHSVGISKNTWISKWRVLFETTPKVFALQNLESTCRFFCSCVRNALKISS